MTYEEFIVEYNKNKNNNRAEKNSINSMGVSFILFSLILLIISILNDAYDNIFVFVFIFGFGSTVIFIFLGRFLLSLKNKFNRKNTKLITTILFYIGLIILYFLCSFISFLPIVFALY
jgi:ABC-type nickel/cobalt efflux system permease component RcnA